MTGAAIARKQTANVVTKAEFARRLNLGENGRQRVQELVKMGVISERKDGQLNYAPALASAQAYLSQSLASQKVQDGKQALTVKRLMLVCERLQFDLDVEKGKFILQAAVERDMEAFVCRTKTVLLRIPQSIGNILGVDAAKKADAMIVEAMKELEEKPLG